MAERFDAYYDSISCKSTGRHIHADGEFVLAGDYAALEAELARVKAESLRAVAAKETCSLNECSERFYIQPTCRHDRQVTEKNIQADFRRHPDTTVLPVRLERWEDEG